MLCHLHRLQSRRLTIPSSISRCISTQQHFVIQQLPVFQDSYMGISQRYCDALKASAYQQSTFTTQKIHANLISSGLYSSTFLQNHLTDTYSRSGLINDAFKVFLEIEFPNVFSWNTMINGFVDSGAMIEADKLFDEMPERDTVSWNSMMSGYFKNGRVGDVVRVFVIMFSDCYGGPNLFSFSCVMKAVAMLGYLQIALQLHGLVQKFEYLGDTDVGSSLLDLYIKCGALKYAEKVFSRIAIPGLFCWKIPNCMESIRLLICFITLSVMLFLGTR